MKQDSPKQSTDKLLEDLVNALKTSIWEEFDFGAFKTDKGEIEWSGSLRWDNHQRTCFAKNPEETLELLFTDLATTIPKKERDCGHKGQYQNQRLRSFPPDEFLKLCISAHSLQCQFPEIDILIHLDDDSRNCCENFKRSYVQWTHGIFSCRVFRQILESSEPEWMEVEDLTNERQIGKFAELYQFLNLELAYE